MECAPQPPPPRDFVPLIHEIMAARATAQRSLARQTGISKSRLGALLHSKPEKRPVMTVPELEAILYALDMTLLRALTYLDNYAELDLETRERYSVLLITLCEMFTDLPAKVIAVLEELNAIDGTEFDVRWYLTLQKNVIEKVLEGVLGIHRRREHMAKGDGFGF